MLWNPEFEDHPRWRRVSHIGRRTVCAAQPLSDRRSASGANSESHAETDHNPIGGLMKCRVVCILATTLTIAVVAHAQNVNTDSNPSAPFATYKTYAWTPGTPSPNPLSEQ